MNPLKNKRRMLFGHPERSARFSFNAWQVGSLKDSSLRSE
jgi:hypothetical protein